MKYALLLPLAPAVLGPAAAEDNVLLIQTQPGGGKRLVVGAHHVMAFLGPLGVTASFWPILKRP